LRISWDYSDYGDYANDNVFAYWFQTHEPDLPQVNTCLQDKSATGDLLLIKEDENGTQDHLVDYEISVINRNHCNQSDLRHAEAILQSESHDKDCTIENNNTSPEKARANHVPHSKQICKLAELPTYKAARERQTLSLHVATHVATPANHGGQQEHRMDTSRMN
jgi:hypothetical protein